MTRRLLSRLIPGSIALLLAAIAIVPALADGTEMLGPPSIPIATGTNIVGGGIGLADAQPDTMTVTIPAGAMIKQVLLYWEGQTIAPAPGDPTIVVNGQAITGTLIGGPTVFFQSGGNDIQSSAFRADITARGLVLPGTNNLVVQGLDFNFSNDGAGVMVIIEEPGTASQIAIRDGDDLAFRDFAGPLMGTVAQTFTFASSPQSRTANLVMLFGSVVGPLSGSGPHRPNSIAVTVGNSPPQIFSDRLGSANGDEWDTLTLPIMIPAGATSLTVQAFSRDDLGSGDLPASLTWVGTGLSVPSLCSGVIGDFVWNDTDRDGIQDGGEPGISGVAVRLKNAGGTVIGTTSTNGDGLYQFTGLCAGSYTVEVDTPSGFVVSPCNVGDDGLDNDCSPEPVTLAADNSTNLTIDFGFNTSCTGVIGDFVWNDTNRDGIQDAGEPGIAGRSVRLKNAAGSVIATTTTNGAGGIYQFTNLCAGTYTVETDTPAGFVPSPCNVGDDALDNDCSPEPVTLPADNSSNQTIDFGFNAPCTGIIGDFVWNDTNRDGIQDAGEPGISGRSVRLKNAAGSVIATTTTNGAGGIYQFTGLCAGSYTVETDTPAGFIASPCNVGDDALDNDCSPEPVTLPADDSSDQTIDFGFNAPCSGVIGDFVWNDLDQNGIQGAAEPGINGVVVQLKNAAGTVIGSTTTSASGLYQFPNLCAGTYTVEVDPTTVPGGFIPSPCNVGSDSLDNDCSPAPVTLASDTTTDLTIDFGYHACTGTIGDFVWNDTDRDGVQDAGEPGINGVKVVLFNAADMVIDMKKTDGTGLYTFTGVCAGTYRVEVDAISLPQGFVPSPCDVGSDSLDNDCSPEPVTLPTDNTINLTIDFGYNVPCTGVIGDFVWNDTDRDGIQDAGEPGISGRSVRLKNAAGSVIATTTTNGAGGIYQFTGLCAGSYTVETDTPAGFVPSPCDVGSDASDNDCSPEPVVLPADNSTNLTIDFGFNSPCTGVIGDFVWNDTDRDGVQDAGEPGISGRSVRLKNAAGSVIATTTTNGAGGIYQFTGLCAGSYTVETDTPAGFGPSPCDVGSDASDNDCSPEPVVLPADNSSNQTIDFGFNAPCAGVIGDFVWNDVNQNGIQDAGELGINGVVVLLKNAAGSVIRSDKTDGSGLYLFSGLCAGSYTVEVDPTTLPTGFIPSPCDVGNDTLDNDCSPEPVSLPTDSTTIRTIDFGYHACTGVVGDFVWNDTDRDGVQDAGEPGINGVVVRLKNAGGTVIGTTTTNGNGLYQFPGLCAGSYTVEVDATTLPTGFVPSPCDVGTDTLDNDCSPEPVTLPADNSSNQTIDFGYSVPCTGVIGDFVWNDTDRDGVQDAGEPGITGRSIRLKNAAGTVIRTTTTNGAGGIYQFTGLCAGSYTVETDTPAGFVPSPCDVGSDATDNDCSPEPVTLPADNSSNQTIDFGFNAPCSGAIGDFVWNDTDRDGIQDAGEPGITGRSVRLKNAAGSVIGTTTTNGAGGIYQFTGLCAGSYTVETDTPSGLVPSPCDVGNDATDNDCSPEPVVLPNDNASNQTIDFGFNAPCLGVIGDFVWNDTDRDGIQDAGEPGIPGVAVRLKNAAGTVIGSTTTAAGGLYQFTGLCAGSYTVEVDTPSGTVPSPCDVGSDTTDNDCSPEPVVLPNDSTTNTTIDFGFNSPSTPVCTTDPSGNVVPAGTLTTVVDANGDVTVLYEQSRNLNDNSYGDNIVNWPRSHSFGDLVGSDKAQFVFTNAAGSVVFDFTLDYVSTKSGTPSGHASLGATGGEGKVNSGQASFLLAWNTSIAQNLNDNGFCMGGSCTFQGTNLLEDSPATNPPNTSYTVANPAFAAWNFTNSYQVKVSHLAFGASGFGSVSVPFLHNSPPKFGSNLTTTVPCPPLPCTGAIGDFVWSDTDGDGVQDAGEPGIPGVAVRLKNAAGTVIASTTTSGNGLYQFTGLCAGSYTVEADTPAGSAPSPCDVGNDATDNDCSPEPVVLPNDSTTNTTIDFGFNGLCSGRIGDFVWNDLDQDGVQEAGEPGINGVTVRLENGSGGLLATTTTGGAGAYLFSGLCAGNYSVEIDPATLPAGSLASPCNVGDDALDNDCSPAAVTLPADTTSNLTIDFGYYSLSTPICPADNPTGGSIASLTTTVDANGDVTVLLEQNRDNANDNSYGANVVNWGRSHTFGDLVGSDKAQFQFKNASGAVVFDVTIDYISVKAGTPSGYGTLGASGGEGKVNSGNAAWLLAFDTSFDANLNDQGFCTSGNCVFMGTDLKVNSPAASTSYIPVNPAFNAWNFTNSYTVKVSHLAFGSSGFGSVALASIHNSPSKGFSGAGVPCPTGGGGTDFCAGGAKPKALTMQYTGDSCSATHHSQDEGKVTCSGTLSGQTPVRILAIDKANPNDSKRKIFFDGTVALNDQFNITAVSRLSTNTYVFVYSGTTLVQSILFHTSCSQPLIQGDQYGSLKLVGFTASTSLVDDSLPWQSLDMADDVDVDDQPYQGAPEEPNGP